MMGAHIRGLHSLLGPLAVGQNIIFPLFQGDHMAPYPHLRFTTFPTLRGQICCRLSCKSSITTNLSCSGYKKCKS